MPPVIGKSKYNFLNTLVSSRITQLIGKFYNFWMGLSRCFICSKILEIHRKEASLLEPDCNKDSLAGGVRQWTWVFCEDLRIVK